jgi:hypothetical protein
VTRRILFLAFLTVVMVGSSNRPGTAQNKVELVKYPMPGSEDTVGEVRTKEDRKVLDDFYQSKVAEAYGHRADGPLQAEQAVLISERFGLGERLTKAQVQADAQAGHNRMLNFKHDHIHLVPFGENVVVVSGRSMSVREEKGKVFNGPRLFSFVWVKLGGRWQMIQASVSDAPEGLGRGFE